MRQQTCTLRPLRMKCYLKPDCEEWADRLIFNLITNEDEPCCKKHGEQLGLRGRPLPDVAITREEM